MSYDLRLREARKRAGLTQEELGKLIGCAKTTITGYETGKSEPNMNVLSKMMEVLGVDANFIFQDEMREQYEHQATPEEMENIISKYRKLDNRGKQFIQFALSYALGDTASYNFDADVNAIKFPTKVSFKVSEQPASAGAGTYLGPDGFYEIKVDPDRVAGADFGVPVRGDSMEPRFHNGDIILISMSQPVEVGDIALVTMDGCGYVKKIGQNELLSLNKKYAPIPMTEDVRVNGKVIGVLLAQNDALQQ